MRFLCFLTLSLEYSSGVLRSSESLFFSGVLRLSEDSFSVSSIVSKFENKFCLYKDSASFFFVSDIVKLGKPYAIIAPITPVLIIADVINKFVLFEYIIIYYIYLFI